MTLIQYYKISAWRHWGYMMQKVCFHGYNELIHRIWLRFYECNKTCKRWLQSCRQLMELVHTSSLRLLKTLAPLPFAMIWDLLHWSQWHPRLMMMIIDHGIKIGKYMTETKQKWLKTDKHGRKNWWNVEEKFNVGHIQFLHF